MWAYKPANELPKATGYNEVVRVRVLLFGRLAERLGRREDVIDLSEPATAGDVYAHYRELEPGLGELGKHLLIAVNQEFSPAEARLKDCDEVALLPPMSGGADVETTTHSIIVELTRHRIDTESLRARIATHGAGAVVVFDGVVRNHSGQRTTLRLEYQAYEPMAVRKMQAIAESALRRWPIEAVAIQHRLGTLEIGESSVVIVVTAAHRRPAFDACSYLIDTIKKTVPIWKKEFFTDGTEWVEGELPPLNFNGS